MDRKRRRIERSRSKIDRDEVRWIDRMIEKYGEE